LSGIALVSLAEIASIRALYCGASLIEEAEQRSAHLLRSRLLLQMIASNVMLV
jgi:hypothetical protein